MRLPEKSRGGDLFSFMHLDAVSSQDGGARRAGCLAAVDEENFFVGKKPAATKWWAVHTTPPKRARPLGKAIRPKSVPRAGGSQHELRKPRARRLGAFGSFQKSFIGAWRPYHSPVGAGSCVLPASAGPGVSRSGRLTRSAYAG